MVHKGGNFVLFDSAGKPGAFSFAAVLLKGKRLQWLLNYRDQRNYALFQIEKLQFTAKDVANGSAKDRAKIALGSNQSSLQVSIALAAHSITTSILDGGYWRIVDTWTSQDTDFTKGKFGFLIPGSDQIGLANFGFTPN